MEGTFSGTVQWTPDDVVFKGETDYRATVTLTPLAGYKFAEGSEVTHEAVADSVSFTKVSDNLVGTITFPKTIAGDHEIGLGTSPKLDLTTLIPAPSAGQAPTRTFQGAVGEDAFEGTVAWKQDDGTSHNGNFEVGKHYTAEVTLKPKNPGAYFPEDTSIIHREVPKTFPIQTSRSENGHLAATLKFQKIPPIPAVWALGGENVLNVFEDFNAIPGIYAAGYGNGEFLVGPSVFEMTASSADGASWTINDSIWLMELVRHIVYGNGMFVAGAEFNHPFNNYAFYSTDNGKTWQTGDTEGIFDVMHSDTIRGMAYGSANGDGTFVAVGGNPSTSTDKAKAMYSKDGKKWTGTNLGLGNVMNRAVAYGGGTFVAMNGEGKAAYSTDGVNWTPASSSVLDPGNGEIGIAYDAGNKRFVAVADNGNAAYSDDNGKTWTPVNDKNLKLIKAFSDIDWGGGYFLAGGYNSNDEKGKGKLVYSADGITWHVTGDNYSEEITYSGSTRRDESIHPNLYVVYGNGKFLVTGDSAIMYSYPME
jgi:hypothetical protein